MRRKRIQVSSGTYWRALATLPRRITSQMDQTAASTLCCVASFFPVLASPLLAVLAGRGMASIVSVEGFTQESRGEGFDGGQFVSNHPHELIRFFERESVKTVAYLSLNV